MTGMIERTEASWAKHQTWPPTDVRTRWRDIESYRRRYRNSKTELIQANPNIMMDNHKVSIYTPVPWPRELCRFSSALLFASEPRVTTAEDQERVESLLRISDFEAFAIRGGVMAACEGRMGIRVLRDPIIASRPILTLVPEDRILWDIRHDTFVVGGLVVIERVEQSHDRDAPIRYRLLEEHSPGVVRRVLFKGWDHELGKRVPLTSYPEFASLAPEESTGLSAATLVPWENIPGAESDLLGLGPIFDELNEAESLLLDRGRKSTPRLFVDRSLLDDTGRALIDGMIITGGSRMRAPLGAKATDEILLTDPKLQTKEHIEWLDHLTQLIVTCAGYSPLTWGIQGKTASVTRAVSGYAMKLAQLRTLLNRAGKAHMAARALGQAIAVASAWDIQAHDVAEFVPSLALGDGLPNDALDGAQEVLYLHQAEAASTETLVRTVHPTWNDVEIQAEVDKIMDEAAVPPGQGPAVGIGPIPRRVHAVLDDADPEDSLGTP